MLRKGAIQQVQPEPGQYLSILFLVEKIDGEYKLAINLKYLKAFILY